MTIALRDRRKREWFWGEKSAIARMEDDAQIAVYVALLILSGEGSLIWASQDTLSRTAKVSTRTVARVLPDLERLRVIRRANERTLAKLAERLQEVPGTVVYELVSVEAGEPEQREPEDERGIYERIGDIQEGLPIAAHKKAFVGIMVKWMRQQTGREIEFPWMIKLYDQSKQMWGELGEQHLIEAAQKTLKGNPAGSVLGYMTKVLRSTAQVKIADVVLDAHLNKATEEQFKGF